MKKFLIKKEILRKNYFFYLMYAIFPLILNIQLFSKKGVFGSRHDWGFPVDALGLQTMFQSAWSFLDKYQFGTQSTYPTDLLFRLFFGSFGYIGVSGAQIAKFIVWFSLCIAGISMHRLIRSITSKQAPTRSLYAAVITSVFYMFGPVLFNKIIAGHIYYTLAYGLSPLFIEQYIKSLRADSIKQKLTNAIYAGIIFTICGFQIQYFIMLFFLSIGFSFSDGFSFRVVKQIFWSWCVIGGMAIITNFPWMAFSFNEKTIAQTGSSATNFAWVQFMSSNSITQTVGLTGWFPHYFTDSYPNYALFHIATLFLLCAVMYFAIRSFREPLIKASVVFILIGWVLTMGVYGPLSFAMDWMFAKLPLFSMFRELYDTTFLAAFGYAIIIGVGLSLPKSTHKWLRYDAWIMSLIVVLFCIPSYTNQLSQNIITVSYDAQYENLMQVLQKDQHQRVAWLPMFQPAGFPGAAYDGIDLMNQFSPQPSFNEENIDSGYENHVGYFIANSLYQQNTGVSKLLSLFNIGSIVDRKNYQTDFYQYVALGAYPTLFTPWTKPLYPFLQTQPGLTATQSNNEYTVFKNTANENDYVQTSQAPIAISGGLGGITSLIGLPPALSNQWDSYLLLNQQTPPFIQTKAVLFDNNDQFDAVLPFATNTVLLQPGNEAEQDYASDGWVSTYNWWWYNSSFSSNPINGIFTTEPKAVWQTTFQAQKGIYVVAVQALEHRSGGSMVVTIDGKRQTIEEAFPFRNQYVWQDLGEYRLEKQNTATIVNTTGNNSMGEIALIPLANWQAAWRAEGSAFAQKEVVLSHSSAQEWIASRISIVPDASWKLIQCVNVNTVCQLQVQNGVAAIHADFHGVPDQYADVNIPTQIDIQEHPIMGIHFTVQNPSDQLIQIGFDMENKKTGKTTTFWGNPWMVEEGDTVNQTDYINVLQSLENEGLATNDIVKSIHLLFHKKWGVDAKAQTYAFTIQNIFFYTAPGHVSANPSYVIVDAPQAGTYEGLLQGNGTQTDQSIQLNTGTESADASMNQLFDIALVKGRNELEITSDEQAQIRNLTFVLPSPNKTQSSTILPLSITETNSTTYHIDNPNNISEIASVDYNKSALWVLRNIQTGSIVPSFMINGYADGFLVPPGDYLLTYQPQKDFAMFLKIVIGIWALLIAFVAFQLIRRFTISRLTNSHRPHA